MKSTGIPAHSPAEFDASAVGSSSEIARKVADEIRTNGVAILRRALPPEMVLSARTALITAQEEDTRAYGDTYPYPGMVHALMTRSAVFLEVLARPVVLAASRAVLGHGCIVSAFNSSSLAPRSTNYTSRIHVDSPRLIPGYITNLGFIFALDPFTESNGAMEIAPGLLHRTRCPSEQEFQAARMVLDDLAPGDAFCFNVRCWHRGGQNRTESARHAITLNVCRNYMRQQFDYPRMLGLKKMEELSPDLQQFLGHYVRMPTSMDEFLLPADVRPYRAGQE